MSTPPPPPSQGPMQVEPLGYFTPSGPPRPGILVAVGVISIILSLWGILSSCSGFAQVWLIGAMAIPVVNPPTTTTSTGTVTAPAAVGTARMTPAERQIVALALIGRQSLSPKRQEMLDMLLIQCGDDVLPFSGSNITPESVAATISGSGAVPAGDGTANTFYTLVNGRIEIGDDSAVFSPTGGKASTRVYRNPSGVSGTKITRAGPTFTMTTVARSPGATAFGIAVYVLSLLLAILLLVAGIVVLNNRRSGRKFHLIYALLKIPVSALAGVVTYQLTSPMLTAMNATINSTYATGFLVGQLIFSIGLGCLYPLALLIVMNTQTVRNYYRSLTAH